MLIIEVLPGHLKFRIIRQDGISHDFNPSGTYTNVFEASNGFLMCSAGCPEVREVSINNQEEINLFVRGVDSSRDLDELQAPSKEWLDAMLLAVKEYNCMLSGENKEMEPLRLPRF